MATAIRIKLADLLEVLAETSPETKQRPCRNFTQLKLTRPWLTQFSPKQERRRQQKTKPYRSASQEDTRKIIEGDLRAIQKYLKNNASSRRDLEFHLNMTGKAVLRRLDLLKERGIVEHLPGNVYGLVEDLQ